MENRRGSVSQTAVMPARPASRTAPIEGEPAPAFEIRHSRMRSRLTIKLSGPLDHRSAVSFSDQVRALTDGADRQVSLDVAAVSRCSSAGVIALVGLRHFIEATGASFTMSGPSTAVQDALTGAPWAENLSIESGPPDEPGPSWPLVDRRASGA